MQKQLTIAIAATLIIAGSAGFYGGLTYGQRQSQNRAGQGSAMRTGQRSFDGAAVSQQRTFVGRGQNGGFIAGEVLSVDDTSITLKLPDGGSRIVILSDATSVSKFAEGTRNDLTIGAPVMVTGTANSDGSLTARTVQLRPAAVGATPQP